MTPETKHTPELLPCPFCGLPPKVSHWINGFNKFTHWSVRCVYGNCSCSPETRMFENEKTGKQASIDAWNIRAQGEEMLDANKVLTLATARLEGVK